MADSRSIHLPHPGAPILEWWAGIYDHVFIALSPFYRLRQIGASGVDREAFEPLADPVNQDSLKQHGEIVNWQTVHQAVAPDQPRMSVYRLIWLMCCLGYGERSMADIENAIRVYCGNECLHLPDEDGLPPILHPVFERFLSALECTHVTAWDEFRENSFDIPIAALSAEAPTFFLPKALTGNRVWALHAPDDGVFAAWEFDCTYALIAMTDDAVRQARPESFFEGWYVDSSTIDVLGLPIDWDKRSI